MEKTLEDKLRKLRDSKIPDIKWTPSHFTGRAVDLINQPKEELVKTLAFCVQYWWEIVGHMPEISGKFNDIRTRACEILRKRYCLNTVGILEAINPYIKDANALSEYSTRGFIAKVAMQGHLIIV